MYRLFPCILGVVFIKSTKRMCIYDYVKNRISTLYFDVKKGISRLLRHVAAKHTANTVKVSYCCTENLLSIIKTHNKKVTSEKATPRDQCNCKNKSDCPLDGNCQTSDTVYKCIASTTINPDKIYLRTAEENFKKRYYNHKTSFKNREKTNDTTLSKHVWEVKDKYKETPSLKWSIVKSVPGYSNITKKCLPCPYEKLEIINYPN